VRTPPRDRFPGEISQGDFMTRFLIAICLLTAFLLTATGCEVKVPPPPTGQYQLPDPPSAGGVPRGKAPGGDNKPKDQKPNTAQ
jgi:hypothetical protein